MQRRIAVIATLLLAAGAAFAQAPVRSTEVADTAMARWPLGDVGGTGTPKWDHVEGMVLQGVSGVWYTTADPKYYSYIKDSVDALVAKDGSIATYNASGNAMDDVLMGRMALLLYGVTQQPRYYIAAKTIRQQLAQQPRTPEGGFWHAQQFPDQVWLDNLYLAEPFHAEYAREFQEPKDFDDIALQFMLAEKHLRDPKTGLLYHAWDESKKERWANPVTGQSATFWSRGMGYYMMALVDTLDYFPADHPQRAELIAILNRLATAVALQQDPKSGLWYQVTNKQNAKGNYLESSGSSMFVYALDKGVRMGYLPVRFQAVAQKGYAGLLAHCIQRDASGQIHMSQIAASVALGGNAPYRDGSYAYYTGVKTVSDDPRGMSAFLMASTEAEMAKTALAGCGDTVVMDAWFNSQTRKNAAGETELFHYKWDDEANSGYSFLGHVFQGYGVKTEVLPAAPTLAALKHAQIYMIVSPDIPSKNPNPHYVAPEDVRELTAWVRQGGVLVLMMNDVNNTEFEHVNTLAEKFGIHFNPVDNNLVPGNDYDKGKLIIPEGNAIFAPKKIYMKEICSITPTAPAHTVLTWQDNTVMAVAKLGRGTVYATVDPWFYNEYTDGRKLSTDFEQYGAATELVHWLVKQVPAKK
ncbi:MAG TPA: glycoside hydrolase family 88 protein [Acidobacteriaceae bacterium]|jgi:unsaturated rhamnogalacturonyl hydrolase|nr:glycoside hydrolase family 88 protein [Acidobacteriaceae bacterium]